MTDVIDTKEYHAHMRVRNNTRNQLRQRVAKLEERLDAMNVAYGVASNPTYFSNKGISDDPNYIPVDDDGVWNVSTTTMNLLYAMYRWADKNDIDHEDDWENHLKLMRNHLDNMHGASND